LIGDVLTPLLIGNDREMALTLKILKSAIAATQWEQPAL